MKILKLFFTLFLLLSSPIVLVAQSTGETTQLSSPLKSGSTYLFGHDIVLNNIPTQDQRQVAMCSAFNGWLYVMYSYTEPLSNGAAAKVLKSTDHGMTWTTIHTLIFPGSYLRYMSIDIAVIGDSDQNLKLFLAFVARSSLTPGMGDVMVWRCDEKTGVYEDQLVVDNFAYSVSLASDGMYPATGSNPHSLGVLISKYNSMVQRDSIIFYSSSNGGQSLDSRVSVAGTFNKFLNATLCYGRSYTKNSGRYYAAWEEKTGYGSDVGHIFTAHSEPNFNSPFTDPVMLDTLNAALYNNVRNPAIACQYNNVDNDSSDLTEIILFDKYIAGSGKYDVVGFYNMKSTGTNHFSAINPDPSPDNKMEPSVAFNPFDSSFMLTYHNATAKMLPFLRKNFNMLNPGIWQVISPGYNDSSNVTSPHPKVVLNIAQKQASMVWAAEGVSNNGIALFDAPYLYTGMSTNSYHYKEIVCNIFPNPCNSVLNVSFELHNTEKIAITVYNIAGQPVLTINDREYQSGLHRIASDVSGLPAGTYLVTFQAINFIKTLKLFIFK